MSDLGFAPGIDPRDVVLHLKSVSGFVTGSDPLINGVVTDRGVRRALRQMTARGELWKTMSLALGYASSHDASAADAINALAGGERSQHSHRTSELIRYAQRYDWPDPPPVLFKGAMTLSDEFSADVLNAAAAAIGRIQRCMAAYDPDQEAIRACILGSE